MGVRYLIGGSLASTVHGVARATIDADLVADLRPEHAGPLVKALCGAFYADLDAIRKAIEKRRSFNVIHLRTMFKVDIFVLKDRPFDRAQIERRVKLRIASNPERTAYLATAEDTILAKLEWYRLGRGISDRQWRDVLGVIKQQAKRLDMTYLRHWASVLKVSDLFEKALTEARGGKVK
jgi:hypothetical protein